MIKIPKSEVFAYGKFFTSLYALQKQVYTCTSYDLYFISKF